MLYLISKPVQLLFTPPMSNFFFAMDGNRRKDWFYSRDSRRGGRSNMPRDSTSSSGGYFSNYDPNRRSNWPQARRRPFQRRTYEDMPRSDRVPVRGTLSPTTYTHPEGLPERPLTPPTTTNSTPTTTNSAQLNTPTTQTTPTHTNSTPTHTNSATNSTTTHTNTTHTHPNSIIPPQPLHPNDNTYTPPNQPNLILSRAPEEMTKTMTSELNNELNDKPTSPVTSNLTSSTSEIPGILHTPEDDQDSPSLQLSTWPHQPEPSTSPELSGSLRIPPVYAYILAKAKVAQEEAERVYHINAALRRPTATRLPLEIEFWSQCPELAALGTLREEVPEVLMAAEQRSRLNEAWIPDITPAQVTLYLYDTTIKDPQAHHSQHSQVYTYLGEDDLLKKAFAEVGKDFVRINREFLPWRKPAEVIHLYYHKKYTLRLKLWKNAYRDTRKIADVDLKDLVQREWTQTDQDLFAALFPTLGKKWTLYIESIKGKTEGDIRAYYKYYKKFIQKPPTRPPRPDKKRDPPPDGHWQVHERQMFALLFPHIGKNWSVLANYLVTKNATEIRSYHRLHYKNLSAGERILETHLRDLGPPQVRTEPLALNQRSGHQQAHSTFAGVLFSSYK
ncbi:hypothetical protein NEHOM01_0789 [Nematocida homosporus]|uniref:uncharacterized protein n=1 Tax=Nematocida homosporus TaxID=1912981 RepID=UPI002220E63F|nr:uncharacterized protein NEHOM01_0789 [Nematocida homosporus]KAI5185374.1 hypothetical protein NEHOM01_0789 [Nematocida homosporus]